MNIQISHISYWNAQRIQYCLKARKHFDLSGSANNDTSILKQQQAQEKSKRTAIAATQFLGSADHSHKQEKKRQSAADYNGYLPLRKTADYMLDIVERRAEEFFNPFHMFPSNVLVKAYHHMGKLINELHERRSAFSGNADKSQWSTITVMICPFAVEGSAGFPHLI